MGPKTIFKVTVRRNLEKERCKGQAQGHASCAKEIDFIRRAVGRHSGVLRREIYEQMSTLENCLCGM